MNRIFVKTRSLRLVPANILCALAVLLILAPTPRITDAATCYCDLSSSRGIPDSLSIAGDPPKRLSTQELDNIIAFSRLLGYVRYFHPSDEAAKNSWNAFAIAGMKSIEKASGPKELARLLQGTLRLIAPTVRVFVKGVVPKLPIELLPPKNGTSTKLLAWVHSGPDYSDPYHYRSVRSERESFPEQAAFPSPAKPFIADLGPRISCLIPLSLYTDSLGTLPHFDRSSRPLLSNSFAPSAFDRHTRLADVAIAWNVIQHFYPYFDDVKIDWITELRQTLVRAALDSDEVSFQKTLRRMQARLRDSHGFASYYRRFKGKYIDWKLPFNVTWAENQLVVKSLSPNNKSLITMGDIITEVNGVPSSRFLAEQEQFIPGATSQWKRWWSSFAFPFVEGNRTMSLRVQTGSARARVIHFAQSTVSKDTNRWHDPAARPREIEKGLYYVDLEWITREDFKSALIQLSKARAVIFDLRGYPNNIGGSFLPHLIDSSVSPMPYFYPLVTRPDRTDMVFVPTEKTLIAPEAPRFAGTIVFLTGGRAVSQAEHHLSIVEHYKLGKIIGEPTAGTNGNIHWLTLPSGYDFVWTALRATNYDGSRHHGVGIKPTILVKPTIKGVKEARDEVLERAIEYVRTGK
ncbi:MAG: S41 family peptidase [Ignavibacteriales bacterium]|nr:S41 family peptidase [Ignavibacteriales bacterium]